MPKHLPRYLSPASDSGLQTKARQAFERLKNCTLCPRKCGVDRTAGEKGYCETGSNAVVGDYDAHFGEEAPLVGSHGSGTIFFSHCNLLCNFCQNFDISHRGEGREVSSAQLAQMMLDLQKTGCHNINFVTPSHVVPQILSALAIAVGNGLKIPLVYNSSGYDSVGTLKLLEGVIDIYMPDFKFWDTKIAEQTCHAPDYPAVARKALIEMHRQVGDLVMNEKGMAIRGLLVRHLVLPDRMAGTDKIMQFIAGKISSQTYVNIMHQYRPCGRAAEIKALQRSITTEEYADALAAASQAGISRLDRPRRTFMIH